MTAYLPAAAPPLMLHHGGPQGQHLAALVVILAVHLQLVVPDHLLDLDVSLRRVGVQTVAVGTPAPQVLLTSCTVLRIHATSTMLKQIGERSTDNK